MPAETFNELWERFTRSVEEFDRQRVSSDVVGSPEATRELAANAAAYSYEATASCAALHRQLHELAKMLRERGLVAPDPPPEGLRGKALEGHRILAAIAAYEPASSESASFEEFVAAVEAYIVGQSSGTSDDADEDPDAEATDWNF